MNLVSAFRIPLLKKNIVGHYVKQAGYAVGTAGGFGGKKVKGKVAKVILPVEKDVSKLLTYVCGSNLFKTGEDIKLKPDSEYPDWLWTMRTERLPPLEETDPNTKQYWRRVHKIMNRNAIHERKYRKF